MMIVLAQAPVNAATPDRVGEQLLDKIPELEPAISAESFLSSNMLWIWIVGAVLLLLLILLAVYFWLRTRHHPTIDAPKPELIALLRLDALAQSEPWANSAALSIELSLILREYITGETDDPALYETHQEFHQRLDALTRIPKNCQEATYQLLDDLAKKKYAGPQSQSREAAEDMLRQTRELIQRIAAERSDALQNS